MGRTRISLAICAVAALALAGSANVSSGAAVQRVTTPVVPSLEPQATEALWRTLVRRPRHQRAQAECRPLRGVFYAATDWLRLATKLAATASPCAQYYVSIPPIVGNKTNLRPGEAARIRALGQNFHALAEFHWTTWSRWVTDNATTWYAAGVEMRRRMAQAGFDLAAGDTWAVNEFPSTVRSGSGTARENARELVRGLYEGDTGQRPTRGVVFIAGLGQGTTNVSVYQTNLQNWLADLAFWTDMSAYVSDWSQEVYGDFRRYAVPGAPITLRRDYLNEYLEHALVLARSGPPTIELARGFLQTAFSPVANAAWQFESGYGWTLVPFDQMQAFVSAQVYALRSASIALGLAQDHWGFAWQPRNGSGLSTGDFNSQTSNILDRLGAAIRDSGQVDPNDPGSGACGPPGQNVFCVGDFTGALFNESWKALRAWFGPVLTFATPPQTLVAGQPSAPITLGLLTSTGAPQATTTPIAALLTSGSQQGQFSLSPSGPWASAINVTIPAGGTATPPFYYLDTRAARPQIRATGTGVTTATQIETVGPGAALEVDPRSGLGGHRPARIATVRGNRRRCLRKPAHGSSDLEHQADRPRSRAAEGRHVDDRSGRRTWRQWPCCRTSQVPISASASLRVNPGPIRVSSIRYSARRTVLRVTASVAELGGGPAHAVRTSVVVRRNGRTYFSASKRTDTTGKTTYLVPRATGCFTTKVTSATAPGYRWNGRTPANRFCT